MKKTRLWFALVLLAALLASAIAPAGALAGKVDRPTDLPGESPFIPEYEYGDPEPGSGGSPNQWGDIGLLRKIFVDNLRILFGASIPISSVSRSVAKVKSSQPIRGPR